MATIQTILVSDALEEVTSKIETLVRNQPELSFVQTVSMNEAPESISGLSSTIIWIELQSDSEKGLALLKSLVESNPGSYFVVSKEEIDADLVKRAMQIGALDFLDHQGWSAQIRSVIRRVATKEWGAQKSSKAIRSAIPNANIKKSGAWSIPGKQAHKPITYAKPPTKTIASNPVPSSPAATVQSAVNQEVKPPSLEIQKPISAPRLDKPESESKQEAHEILNSTSVSEIKPAPSIAKDSPGDNFSELDTKSKPVDSIESLIQEPNLDKSIEAQDPISAMIRDAESATVSTTFPEEEPTLEELPTVDNVSNQSKPITNELPEVESDEQTISRKSTQSNSIGSNFSDQDPDKQTVQNKLPGAEHNDSLESLSDDEPEVIRESAPEPEVNDIVVEEKSSPVTSTMQTESTVKKSKWEELDSLISTQRSSQPKIDTINDPVKSMREGVLSSDTKNALVDAVESIDANLGKELDVEKEKAKEKEDLKSSKWDDLDSLPAPEQPVNFLPEMSSVDIDILPMDIMEDDLSSIQKTNEKMKLQAAQSISAQSKTDADGNISDPSLDVVATKSKWGDLDSIGTASSNIEVDNDISPVQENEEASPVAPTETKSKWGNLDSIPTPGKETREINKPSTSSQSKWGDLDNISTPKSTDAPAFEQSAKSGMFSDIEGLDDVKTGEDVGSTSGISQAKWGDSEGSVSGLGTRSRVSGIGRNTGSFGSLQSDPNTSLVNKNQANPDSQASQASGEGEEKPKAMPLPQAQAPNKWTGSGESSGTAVSSSLKSMDDKSSKPLLQKPDIKLSLSLSSAVASGLVASIVALLICFLSASFFTY